MIPIQRIGWLCKTYPARLQRIYKFPSYISELYIYRNASSKWHQLGLLFIDYWFMLTDLLLLADLLYMVLDEIKGGRSLTNKERNLARLLFGDSLELDTIRVDERAYLTTQNWCLAYVSFHTINSKCPLPEKILIHELVHVWQYQIFGSLYIHHALRAQRSAEGYDYGGAVKVYEASRQAKSIFYFNFEQMADLIEHYFEHLQQGDGYTINPLHSYYQYFVAQLSQPQQVIDEVLT